MVGWEWIGAGKPGNRNDREEYRRLGSSNLLNGPVVSCVQPGQLEVAARKAARARVTPSDPTGVQGHSP
ncbi:hypothetical protein VTJ04DRAFT_10166 [Mycothermus thermophilus]|uniref:uncharacterized protein n=1 Tax=Humicola insolens TaxID=85995 RepID=UPI0037443F6A